LADTLESDTHCSAENVVLETEPSFALTDTMKFVKETPTTVRENEAEVAPFITAKLDNAELS